MYSKNDIVSLDGNTVQKLLQNSEKEIMELVRQTYLIHSENDYSLPHSIFLRFPGNASNRIIGLPTYLGGDVQVCGIKWVASFPGNIESGIDRASAVIIVNSVDTGRPLAFVEASYINAYRTAASAVVAARELTRGDAPASCSIIGCGLIGYTVLQFLLAEFPSLGTVTLFDLDEERMQHFSKRASALSSSLEVKFAASALEATRNDDLVVLTTTAGTPWIDDAAEFSSGSIVLHVSLRDIAPAVILQSENIVDDVDHVCRENTSLHLTEKATGHRNFISGSIGELLCGRIAARGDPGKTVIFSPFGLGILDLALARWLLDKASGEGAGEMIENFLPEPWFNRSV